MPLPVILGIAAAVAATGGVGSGIHGAVKMKKAKDIMKSAKRLNDANKERFNMTKKE